MGGKVLDEIETKVNCWYGYINVVFVYVYIFMYVYVCVCVGMSIRGFGSITIGRRHMVIYPHCMAYVNGLRSVELW